MLVDYLHLMQKHKDLKMLHLMRKGAQSYVIKFVLFGLLMLAMTGLVFMDVSGVVRNNIGKGPLVSYKGGKISASEFSETLRQTLRQQKMSEADAYRYGVVQQLLDNEINKVLFLKAASDMGIKVGDKDAALQVKGIIQPLIEQGASEKEALDYVLRNSNVSQAQFLEMIKQHISTQMLLSVILSNSVPSDDLMRDLTIFENQERSGSYFTLTFTDLPKVSSPSDTDLEDYYKTISSNYALPEYRDFSVAIIDKSALGEDLKISDEKVKSYYDENIDRFTTPETREIEQVMFKDKATAEKFADELKSKKDFKEVADKNGAKYVEAKPYSKNALPPALADVAFAAAKGDVTAPAQSPIGWHVMYVKDVTPEKVSSFESVEKDLKKDLEHETLAEHLYELANQIDDEIAGGASFEDVVKNNKLQVKSYKGVTVDGHDASGKDIADQGISTIKAIVKSIYELDEGETSHLTELPDNSFLMAKVDVVTPSIIRPFKDVKAEVAKQWTKQQNLKSLSEKASKAMQRINGGENFANVAKSLNLSVSSTGMIKRYPLKDKASDPINVSLRNSLFSLTKGASTMVNGGNETLFILKLDSTKEPEFSKITQAEKDRVKKMIDSDYRDDAIEEMRTRLIKKYNVKVNNKMLGKMYEDAASREESAE